MSKSTTVESKQAGGAPPQLHTVTQLAAELGITARTLRFYEGKGLITPSRLGTTRVYMARDRARMILILRGKRLGFTLREIQEYLDLYDVDPTLKTQNARLLKFVKARMTKLEQQRTALDEMLLDLQNLQRHAEAALGQMTNPPSKLD
jgi:DNA-binding transcriptional MerR regulator